jgi:hypothetical protein
VLAKKGTSFRLSEEGLELINDLSEKLGISQADVVEMSVRITKTVIERGAEFDYERLGSGPNARPSVGPVPEKLLYE